MFELLPASRPARRWPLSGGALSLAAHVLTAGALLAAGAVSRAAHAPPAPGGSAAEALRFVEVAVAVVGTPDGARTLPAGVPPGAARHPSAFFVPGPRRSSAPDAARGLGRLRVPRVELPELPELFVPGFVSSVPDVASRVTRPDDFAPLARLAERDAARPHDARAPYAPADVERLPVPSADNPRPAYPTGLAHERVGDTVVVQFVVDTTGAVDPGSVVMVRGRYAAFARAVGAVLPRLRFLPGQIGARAVRVVVEQPFLFVPGRAGGA